MNFMEPLLSTNNLNFKKPLRIFEVRISNLKLKKVFQCLKLVQHFSQVLLFVFKVHQCFPFFSGFYRITTLLLSTTCLLRLSYSLLLVCCLSTTLYFLLFYLRTKLNFGSISANHSDFFFCKTYPGPAIKKIRYIFEKN